MTASTHNAEVRKCWGSKMSCWMTQISTDLKGKLQGFKRAVLSSWWLWITPVIHKSSNTGMDPILNSTHYQAQLLKSVNKTWEVCITFTLQRGSQSLWARKALFSSVIQWISSQRPSKLTRCVSVYAARRFAAWVQAHDVVWFAVLVCFSISLFQLLWSPPYLRNVAFLSLFIYMCVFIYTHK